MREILSLTVIIMANKQINKANLSTLEALFQSAYRCGVEDSAKVAEGYAHPRLDDRSMVSKNRQARVIAAAIRRLVPEPPK